MKLIYSNFQFWIITFNLRILTSGSYFFWHGIVICRFLVEILVFWLVWPNLTSQLIFCFCVCLDSQLKLSHPDHLLVKRASAADDNFDRALQSVAWGSWISLFTLSQVGCMVCSMLCGSLVGLIEESSFSVKAYRGSLCYCTGKQFSDV